MNIVGEGLPEKIANQIETRQKIYGSINRTTEEILYLNSRTSFVKAISSVDIVNYNTGSIISTKPELASIVESYGGDLLARNFILFNGTSGGNNTRRAGIVNELLTEPNLYVNDFAYGLGGLEFGIRPMPGIISMQTTSQGTYGSIESTTLNIKAWNRIQFEIIDLLYLRLGYSVLVEWGNTSYFDNDGVYIPENQYTLEPEFLAGDLNPNSIYSRIEQYKLDSNGNYDAIYGIVTNFNWTFGEDGSYDITVKLISKGDIIESLKSAVLVSEKTDIAEPKPITEKELKEAIKNSTDNQLNLVAKEVYGKDLELLSGGDLSPTQVKNLLQNQQLLSNLNKKTTSNTTATPTTTKVLDEEDSTNVLKDSSSLGRLYYNVQQILNDPTNPSVLFGYQYGTVVYNPPDRSDVKSFFSQTYKVPGEGKEYNNSTKYYIRFGTLLAFIETNLIPKEKKGDVLYPSINIDYNVNTNLCYTNNLQISTDPRVCLVSTTVKSKDGTQEFYFAESASPYKTTIAKTQVGQIMNIYINFDTIIETINSNGDPKNQTSILTLLEVLCNKISVALGGVNTFRPFIDTSTNTLKIIDETSLPNKNDILTSDIIGGKSTKNDPVIQIYGYNYLRDSQNNITQGYAGFVKNFKFTSKLDPKFAQIISIGATAQGGVVGEDATAFTSLNRGLKDRIKPEIFASSGFKVDSKINIEEKSPEDQFKDSLADFESYIGSIGVNSEGGRPTLIEAEIESYTNLYNTIMQYTETKNAVSQKKSSGTMGFIPVSVGLTLDGISGLKLLNGIKVDTSYLPSNYPETMLFVISKLAHKVENNIWTTELETIMIPDNTVQPDTVINGKSRRQTGQSSGNSGGGGTGSGGGGSSTPQPEKTLTSGFPMSSRIYSKARSVKTQIYLHHTAGHQRGDKGKSVVDDWNTRKAGSLASTHAIIDRNGFVEFLFSEEYKAFAQGVNGSKVSYNQLGVSVELMALGYKRSSVTLQNYELTPGWVKSVGFDLKPKAWRGYSEWQGYTQEQVNSTIKLIKYWSNMFGIEIPPFTQTVFDNMFPEKDKISPNAKSGKSGLYTHGSVNQKVDINPDPLLVKALKTEFANGYNIGGATKTLKYTQSGFTL